MLVHSEIALGENEDTCYNVEMMSFRRRIGMKNILFICHGNICRSPMAEFVMKDLVKKAGLASQFHIESAATSREEIGNPVYPPVRRKLSEHGISCDGHAARQLTNQDYDKYDLLIGMDRANLRNMHRICGGDFVGKLHLLMDYTDHPRDVADPWYTGDFEVTWRDYANVSQLVCLSNLENLNAVFINEGMPQAERLAKLNAIAISQMKVLTEDHRLLQLEEHKQES